jgi:hypothetical protein
MRVQKPGEGRENLSEIILSKKAIRMNLQSLSKLNIWIGRTGTALCILFVLAVGDGLVARFREPMNHLACLPDSQLAVSGPLPGKIENPEQLISVSNSKEIKLVIEKIQTGFWLGGAMWQGTLKIDHWIQPGGYAFEVRDKRDRGRTEPSHFQVEVYKDATEFRKNSRSFFQHYLGLKPWRASLISFLFIGLTFGTAYLLSQKQETLLAEQGRAEIYRVGKRETSLEIYFGLGKNQGILPGMVLNLSDQRGLPRGVITVAEVFESHALAQVDIDSNVRPGYVISRS